MQMQVGGVEERNSDVLIMHCCVSSSTDSVALLCCGFYCCCTNNQKIGISTLKRRGELTGFVQRNFFASNHQFRGEKREERRERLEGRNHWIQIFFHHPHYNRPHTSL